MLRGHSVQGSASDDNSAESWNMDKLAKARGDFEREKDRWHSADARLEVAAPDEAKIVRQELVGLRMDTDMDVKSLADLISQ